MYRKVYNVLASLKSPSPLDSGSGHFLEHHRVTQYFMTFIVYYAPRRNLYTLTLTTPGTEHQNYLCQVRACPGCLVPEILDVQSSKTGDEETESSFVRGQDGIPAGLARVRSLGCQPNA